MMPLAGAQKPAWSRRAAGRVAGEADGCRSQKTDDAGRGKPTGCAPPGLLAARTPRTNRR